MAIYHLSVKSISRGAGRSATAAAAYRTGADITDARTGERHDYTRRSGVASAFLVLPEDAPVWAADRAALWNAAEGAENRRNSQVAREVIVALPAELDADERREAVGAFAQFLVEWHGVAVDVALHEPGLQGDQRNHHAHLLLSTRVLGPEGFGAKTRELDVKGTASTAVRAWRSEWAEIANWSLERAGHAARIDHRSLEAQGVERAPTQHLGPAGTAMQRSDDRAESTRAAELLEVAAAGRLAGRAAGAAEIEVGILSARLKAAHVEQRTEGMAAARAQFAEQREAEQASEEAQRIEQGVAAVREQFAVQREAERQRQALERQREEELERKVAELALERSRGRGMGW